MRQSLILALIISGIVVSESIAQYCVKKSKMSDRKYYFCGAILAYAVVCVLLYYSYDYRSMGLVNALWSAFSVLAIVAVGRYFYNEELYVWDLIGIAFII